MTALCNRQRHPAFHRGITAKKCIVKNSGRLLGHLMITDSSGKAGSQINYITVPKSINLPLFSESATSAQVTETFDPPLYGSVRQNEGERLHYTLCLQMEARTPSCLSFPQLKMKIKTNLFLDGVGEDLFPVWHSPWGQEKGN